MPMHIRRDTHDGPPRNAWAAARAGQGAAVSAPIDPHNARFIARFIVSMMVLLTSVVLFCLVVLFLLDKFEEASRATLPTVPLEYRYSR